MWKFLNGKWMLFAPENEGGAAEAEGEPEPDDEPEGEPEGEDEPEPEGDPEPEGEPDPGVARRGETRFQKLANETREARERAIAAETEARVLREQQQKQPAQDNGAAALRAEKLALMTPEEKREFFRDEEIAQLKRNQEVNNIRSYDFADKADYNAIAVQNTVEGRLYAKNKERVEKTLMAERAQGRNPTRAGILRILLGDDMLKAKPGKQVAQKKADAASRVASSQSKPLSAKGDAGSSKGGKEETLDQMRERIIAREKAEGRR